MIIVALLLSGSLPAMAQSKGAEPSPELRAQALDKYKRGSDAFAKGAYKDAADLFLRADRLVKRPAFAYNAALAFDNLRDAENALRWAREYLRRSPKADNRQEMETAIRRHEQHLKSKGVQQVTVLSTPESATLLIDDQAVGVTPWTGQLVPGHHRASVRLPGHEAAETTFVLTAERAIDVSIALSEEKTPDAPVDTPTPEPDEPARPDEDRSVALTAVGVVTLVLGAGALGAAGAMEALRAGAEQDAKDEPVQTEALKHLEDADDFQTGARVLIGVGAGLMVAGGIMLVIDLTSDSGDETASLRVECGQRCGLSLSGSF